MKSLQALPADYREIASVDLKKDKKAALLVNALSFGAVLMMAVPMNRRVPVATLLFSMDGVASPGEIAVRLIALCASAFAYIVLHEAVHGLAMKLSGTEKVRFGVTLMYAFAGSDDYYDKKSYLFIALAPLVFWGIVLLAVNLLVPLPWFWVVYFIQMFNVGGSAGDIYVAARFVSLPDDILVRDWGVSMKVYSKK